MRSSIAVDLPIVSLVRLTLFPITVVIILYLITAFRGEAFGKDYLILSFFSFLLALHILGEASFYSALEKFPILIALSDIIPRWILVAFVLIFFNYFTGIFSAIPSSLLNQWMIVTPFALVAAQLLAVSVTHRVIKGSQTRSAVIVGANKLGKALHKKLADDRFLNIKVKGFFDDRDNLRLDLFGQHFKLGQLSDLPSYAATQRIQIIYICLPTVAQPRIMRLLDELRDTTASIYFVPDIFMVDLIQARIDRITGIPMLAICETPFYGLRGLTKRMTDIVISVLVLFLIWPLMIVIAAAVKATSPGPAIFKQRRYGLDGQEIVVYKFRTMSVCEDGAVVTQASPGDARITPLGRMLRRTSLDELPQFLNVLEGTMSIVGPRPHAVSHNEMYRKVIKAYMIRHKVKPGITGWAQVNGFRGETSSLDKMKWRVEYDLEYLRNWSLALDIWIIIRTALLVLGDKAAY